MDVPMTDYDLELKVKCEVSEDFLKPKPLTVLAGSLTETRDRVQMEDKVRELIEKATPLVKKCHAVRANAVIANTRQQIEAYLEQRPVVRAQTATLVALPLDVSRLEKVAARRLLRNAEYAPAGVTRPYYSVGRTESDHSEYVYPGAVTYLSVIAPIPRSTTCVISCGTHRVEDDPIIRFVPYFTPGSNKVQIPQFSGMEPKKETLVGMDDEVNEFILRYVVNSCGGDMAMDDESGDNTPETVEVVVEQAPVSDENSEKQQDSAQLQNGHINSTSDASTEEPTRLLVADEESKNKSAVQLKICGNVNIMRGCMRKISVSASETHGWGAYSLENVKKGEFIYEYTGSLLSQDEAERRGNVYDKATISFLFDLTEDSVVDATRKGNKSKFANHDSVDPKCFARIMLVNGDHRIGIYAKKDIVAGDELFFDYGYNGVVPDWSQARIGSGKNAPSIEDDTDNDSRASAVDMKEESESLK
ncbi:hypothetical protein BBO99_00003678 [Phytophthora kernoviae]|uniref:SET domain-containing protein n=2 Tax=Phytophthora kernoviae TaxID=325452 RepID=A0A3R7GYJ4_9STRA|nr:hypothetical protein G195_006092 [Phytophthora kernoviae 00238/432]KAG2523500.1 hypothetical protein JM16_002267 [Phytophthora kernoviae]KAG2525420.1 hypothetical protein JM18_002345 [Phytophthora kernoviae]RLN10487.1 hypothetical protein BBI17_003704 [Phytophthora kernoviae]RLN81466.1 hypothetical protein BBO99_00003678 [Phytophthora kernoviae]